jgi:hypothetical protein
MQWGAKQIFAEAVPDYLKANPQSAIYVTPVWANGTDVFPRFFSLDPERVQLHNVDWFADEKRALDPNAAFIATPEEYERAAANPKFKSVQRGGAIQYPNGQNGFYFLRLAYADNVDEIFAAEKQARIQLVTETVSIRGESVQVAHSPFDAGRVQDLFDGDTYTLARGAYANPLVIELKFPGPRAIQTLIATFGSMNFRLTVLAYANENDAPAEYRAQYANLPNDPTVQMNLTRGPDLVGKLHIEIYNLDAGDQAKIHVRELSWK